MLIWGIWKKTTNLMTTNNAVLITAAGSSLRFGRKKEYLRLPEYAETQTTVLSASVYAFAVSGQFRFFVITVPEGDEDATAAMLAEDSKLTEFLRNFQHRLFIVSGGSTRQESVYKGLTVLAEKVPDNIAFVLVHDGARPWVSSQVITDVLKAAEQHGAAVPVIPVVDTQKEIDKEGKIIRHLDRQRIAAVQTPQGFLFNQLLAAHRSARYDGSTYTDDSEIYAKYCGAVYTCPGARKNKKITYQEDLKDTR